MDALPELEAEYSHRSPHWTEAVFSEVETGLNKARQYHMRRIIEASWLGKPISPSVEDQIGIFALHVGLNEGRRPPTEHHGEAESIYFVEKLNGIFVTDDGPASDFAQRRGITVYDTVDVLQHRQLDGELSHDDAWELLQKMLNEGRAIRPRVEIHKEDLIP